MRFLPRMAVLTALVLTMAPAALAAKGQKAESSDEPIHVVSDRLEVDNKTQVANFIGKVKAVQGDVTIDCDQLLVYYDRKEEAPAAGSAESKAETKKDPPKTGEAANKSDGLDDAGGKVRMVVAIGHVKIVQKDRVGLGRKATYWAGGRKVLLEGQATVWRGKNQVSGEKITVFLDEDRSIVHGQPGKRVSVTIAPGGAKDKDKKEKKD